MKVSFEVYQEIKFAYINFRNVVSINNSALAYDNSIRVQFDRRIESLRIHAIDANKRDFSYVGNKTFKFTSSEKLIDKSVLIYLTKESDKTA
ncbi:hypothetical protein [Okeania sp. KiyG1]|uniref:hypothetical protein n=1 Tax=Okeania sp. KiyG1 TaxID=2720165 RepID=UPI001920A65C|nr:hypothetical protein [Okeania sp. KiyG1]GGA56097.1 hypothetical protein CYANOKiyG1_76890 [Okeania sp. KiyG1]